jgi:hypothetical protein
MYYQCGGATLPCLQPIGAAGIIWRLIFPPTNNIGSAMKIYAPLAAVLTALASLTAPATAQTITSGAQTIALKSGESTELGEVYWISNCRSLLKSTPKAELLEGPAELTVAVTEAMVLPRYQNCAKKVPGGKLTVSAKEISDPSISRITVRVTYPTKDGDRQRSQIFNLSLLP